MVVGEQVICRGIINAWEKILDMLKADRVWMRFVAITTAHDNFLAKNEDVGIVNFLSLFRKISERIDY